MSTVREVSEGRQVQGVDEEIVYTLTTTNWGSDPSSPSVVVKDLSAASADVTSTVTSGDASASGDVVTLPTIKSLTQDHIYRVEVKFTCSGSVYEAYFLIDAEL